MTENSSKSSPLNAFANSVLLDWNSAIDDFFKAVDRKRRTCDLAAAEVRHALSIGYGRDVAYEWDAWCGARASVDGEPVVNESDHPTDKVELTQLLWRAYLTANSERGAFDWAVEAILSSEWLAEVRREGAEQGRSS